MLHRVLFTNKLRVASAGIASVMLAAFVLPTALVFAAAPTVTDNDTHVTAGEVQNALSHSKGVIDTSGLKTAVGGVTVTVPKNPRDGVTLGSNGSQLAIQLPNASHDANATKVSNGVVAYAGDNGSANAVQTTDGGVRMLTVIDSPNAPTTYDYKITVPHGGSIRLFPDNSGAVLDSSGHAVAFIAIPWATDATGKHIQTYFTTDGQTLTQHIEHNVPGVVYPVTADPNVYWSWWGVTIYVNQGTVNRIIALMGMGAGAISIGTAVAAASGAGAVPAAIAWAIGVGILGFGASVLQTCSWRGNGTWLHIHYWGPSWCNG